MDIQTCYKTAQWLRVSYITILVVAFVGMAAYLGLSPEINQKLIAWWAVGVIGASIILPHASFAYVVYYLYPKVP